VATSISSLATRPLMFGVVACGLLGSSRSGMTLTRKTPCPSAHGEKAGGGRGGEVGRSAAGGVRRGRRRGVRWSLSTRQPLCRGRAPHQGAGYSHIARRSIRAIGRVSGSCALSQRLGTVRRAVPMRGRALEMTRGRSSPRESCQVSAGAGAASRLIARPGGRRGAVACQRSSSSRTMAATLPASPFRGRSRHAASAAARPCWCQLAEISARGIPTACATTAVTLTIATGEDRRRCQIASRHVDHAASSAACWLSLLSIQVGSARRSSV
jgi:hypothetical protein